MTLDAALALIAELRAQNAALWEQNAQLRTENQVLQARVAVPEQRVAELEAGGLPALGRANPGLVAYST
jgi:cell division protein FtsB